MFRRRFCFIGVYSSSGLFVKGNVLSIFRMLGIVMCVRDLVVIGIDRKYLSFWIFIDNK